MAQQDNTILFEDARLMFRNFSGKEGKFNPAGKRNFCLFLDPETAAQMAQDGWNIKQLTPRDDQEDPQPYVQVAVNFGGRPPKIMMVTSKGKTPIGEDMASILDWAEFKKVDVIINPYKWEVQGKSGVKAYLKTMYATLEEDDLDKKYSDVPDSGQDPTIREDEFEDTPPF